MENKNFTMISNEIIKELTANDLAVYCKMKYFSGMTGQCYASKIRIRKELGLGHLAITKSIKSLRNLNLITKAGTKQTMTAGGPQEIDIYNIKGVLERSKGCPRTDTSNTITKKEEKAICSGTPFVKKVESISPEELKNEEENRERIQKKLREMGESLKNKWSIKKTNIAMI